MVFLVPCYQAVVRFTLFRSAPDAEGNSHNFDCNQADCILSFYLTVLVNLTDCKSLLLMLCTEHVNVMSCYSLSNVN
jgi:hypothetical protein